MRISFILLLLLVVLALELVVVVYRHESAPPRVEPAVALAPTSAPRPRAHPAGSGLATDLPALAAKGTNQLTATNLYQRLETGEFPKLTPEQIEPFLAKHHRNVDALLGALRSADDDRYLKEATERFPNDPRVQFAAAFKSENPEERLQWLAKLKASAPDNSLPSYLLAGASLKAGKTEEGLQELVAAGAKGRFDNYLVDFMQNAEEAYRAGGYTDAEAKAVACSSALLPELAPFKEVGQGLNELIKRYRESGDTASAEAAMLAGVKLGQRMEGDSQITLIQNLVGIAIERLSLGAMDPTAPFGTTGQTVQDQIDAASARRKSYRELVSQSQPILSQMSDSELGQYFDRMKLYGEVPTLRWVLTQAPTAN